MELPASKINVIFGNLISFLLEHGQVNVDGIEKIRDVFNLTVILTSDYDESHDINHHVDVYRNAIIILKSFGGSDKLQMDSDKYHYLCDLLMYSSLLHDTIDHKYKNRIEEKILCVNDFLKNTVQEKYADIKWIIDNISYSKEHKNGYPLHHDKIVQLARDIISDADKLEAIGDKGLERCYQFTIACNPGISDENATKIVVEHCHEKLLKLKDNFIRTEKGKKMALPLHMILVDFVNNYDINH